MQLRSQEFVFLLLQVSILLSFKYFLIPNDFHVSNLLRITMYIFREIREEKVGRIICFRENRLSLG